MSSSALATASGTPSTQPPAGLEAEPALGRRQRSYLFGAAAMVILGIPLFADVVILLRSTEIFVFMVAFAGLHVLSGRLGLISIGHGAFVGIGGLGAAHGISDLGLPYLLCPLAGALAAAVFGGIIAFPSLRLPGAYLALLTVAVAMALPIAMRRIDGPLGVRVEGDLLPPAWTGLARDQDDIWQYAMVVIGSLLAFALVHRVMGGPFGRSLLAVRDEPTAAAAFGINVPRTHLLGVALSSALAGYAGGLLVFATPFVSGNEYPFSLSLSMFALMVAFGSSNLWTSIPASVMLIMLPVFLVEQGWAIWEPIIYGLALLLMTRVSRGKGLVSFLEDGRKSDGFQRAMSKVSRTNTFEADPTGIVVLDGDRERPEKIQ